MAVILLCCLLGRAELNLAYLALVSKPSADGRASACETHSWTVVHLQVQAHSLLQPPGSKLSGSGLLLYILCQRHHVESTFLMVLLHSVLAIKVKADAPSCMHSGPGSRCLLPSILPYSPAVASALPLLFLQHTFMHHLLSCIHAQTGQGSQGRLCCLDAVCLWDA